MKVCSIENCEREHYARGWCQMHYGRWRKYGDTMPDKKPRERKTVEKGALCTIEGCERTYYARGWCRMHYSRWVRKGTPRRKIKKCVVVDPEGEECPNEHAALDMCKKHYSQYWRGKDPRPQPEPERNDGFWDQVDRYTQERMSGRY